MRDIKKPNSAIIEGQRIYYDHIRPHTALNGKTPAEACGIGIEGKNKWLTLIQNASQKWKIHHATRTLDLISARSLALFAPV
jgi:hypothetical protein